MRNKKEEQFKKDYCKRCANKETNLCEIHRTIDGEYKCPYFEPEGLGLSLVIIILIEVLILSLVLTIIGG